MALRRLLRFFSFAILIAMVCGAAAAQEKPDTAALLQKIFVSGEFYGRGGLGQIRWIDNGDAYLKLDPSTAVPQGRDIVRYATATQQPEVLVSAAQLIPRGEKSPLRVEDFAFSKDMKRLLIYTNSQRVWRQNTRGDYWVLDREARSLKKLGGNAPASSLMFAKFSPDATRVAYVRANNLYVEDLKTGKITQLTRDGSDKIINGATDWVYEEEFDLRDAFRWSPDGRKLAFWQFDTNGVQNFALLYPLGPAKQIVTQIPYTQVGAYPTILNIPYPQPGTPNSAVRVGVVGAHGGKVRWMQVPGDSRDNYVARMEWAGNSTELLLQHLNRLQNTDDFLLANANTGAVKTILRDQDQAWVDVNEVEFLRQGAEFLVISERDGWRHAYRVPHDGGPLQLVTRGDYDMIRLARVDEKEGYLYFTASPENATQRYLYRTKLDGTGQLERVTPAGLPGMHSYNLSPNCRWAIHGYSTFDTPPMQELVQLPEHKQVKLLLDNTEMKTKVAPLIFSPVEFFQVDVGEGVKLDGYMIKPPNFDPAKKYPILFHVYGEPASQTVLDQFGSMFHRLIASQGYLVASIDNRGTPAPKGRAWRKVIYGTVGVLASKEQAVAVRELERTRPYIDPHRVAVWGWSGGGTQTLNLLFRSPDVYQTGLAVASVPDQRLYDSIYQERYMGLPQQNVQGYKDASAINFAEGLKGNLLIVHGSGDDNVHYQGAELLVNRLIELGKQFDFMTYPDRTHGISEGKGTTLHVYALLLRYLNEHCPPGAATETSTAGGR